MLREFETHLSDNQGDGPGIQQPESFHLYLLQNHLCTDNNYYGYMTTMIAGGGSRSISYYMQGVIVVSANKSRLFKMNEADNLKSTVKRRRRNYRCKKAVIRRWWIVRFYVVGKKPCSEVSFGSWGNHPS